MCYANIRKNFIMMFTNNKKTLNISQILISSQCSAETSTKEFLD